MEMDEQFLQQWLSTLRELKDFLECQKRSPRPTEVIVPKTELLIRDLIDQQEDKCIQGCEKRIKTATAPLCKDLKRLEKQVTGLDDGVEEASKTAHSDVRSMMGRLDLLEGRLSENDGYENRMNATESWIRGEKAKATEEQSSFKNKLAVVAIIISLIFGLTGMTIGILQLALG
jgi:hypothetical protein